MNLLKSVASILTLMALTSTAFAQQCENGICRIGGSGEFSGIRPNSVRRSPDPFQQYGVPQTLSFGSARNYDSNKPCRCGTDCTACGFDNCNCATKSNKSGNTGGGHSQRFEQRSPRYESAAGPGRQPIQAPELRRDQWRNVSLPSAVSWRSDLNVAVQEAQRTRRPVLVRFSADWCGHCQRMTSETFADSQVIQDISSSFIAVELNADTNRDLIQRMAITSLPTMLVLSPDGRILDRESGFRSADQLGQLLRKHMQRAQLQTGRRLADHTPTNVAL